MTSTRLPAPLLGLVTHRRRLCAALGIGEREAVTALSAQVRAAAAAQLTFVQVREPDLDAATLLALTRALVAAAAGRVRIVVNDRVDVATAAGADVHLKATSLPAARVRTWAPAGMWVSRAVHGAAEATAAGPVDLILAGTLAPTPSKDPDSALLGLDGLRAIVGVSQVPVLAIGGVTPASWPAIAATDAAGCAAIGAFLPAPGETVDAAVEGAAAAFRGVDCAWDGFLRSSVRRCTPSADRLY